MARRRARRRWETITIFPPVVSRTASGGKRVVRGGGIVTSAIRTERTADVTESGDVRSSVRETVFRVRSDSDVDLMLTQWEDWVLATRENAEYNVVGVQRSPVNPRLFLNVIAKYRGGGAGELERPLFPTLPTDILPEIPPAASAQVQAAIAALSSGLAALRDEVRRHHPVLPAHTRYWLWRNAMGLPSAADIMASDISSESDELTVRPPLPAEITNGRSWPYLAVRGDVADIRVGAISRLPGFADPVAIDFNGAEYHVYGPRSPRGFVAAQYEQDTLFEVERP